MMGNITDYVVRFLLAIAGIGNITLATLENESNSLLLKILLFMSGVITLLLSVFFTGFMIHLANHSRDRSILFGEINKQLNEIKEEIKNGREQK